MLVFVGLALIAMLVERSAKRSPEAAEPKALEA